MLTFHFVAKSANAKIGTMPATYSPRQTCPDSCPFKKNGCYADSGHTAINWNKVSSGERGDSYTVFLEKIAQLPRNTIWRHNVAGDLYKPGTLTGRKALQRLTDANRGKLGYTYSHHELTPSVVDAFLEANKNGFTINASCESEAQADAAIKNGLPAVMVVNSDESRINWKTNGGNKVVICPNQTRDVKCKDCRLCHHRPSNLIVAFKAHGSRKEKVNQSL
jgi:hypothetical protein